MIDFDEQLRSLSQRLKVERPVRRGSRSRSSPGVAAAEDSDSGPEYHPNAASSGLAAPPPAAPPPAATAAAPAATAGGSATRAAAWAAQNVLNIPVAVDRQKKHYIGIVPDTLFHPATVMLKHQSPRTIENAAMLLSNPSASAFERVQQVLKAIYRWSPESIRQLVEHMRAARAQAKINRMRQRKSIPSALQRATPENPDESSSDDSNSN